MSNEDPRGHIEDDLTVSMIVDAVANIDATEFERLSSGDDVSELSSNTEFESIEVVPGESCVQDPMASRRPPPFTLP
jgi:hypothetical protein